MLTLAVLLVAGSAAAQTVTSTSGSQSATQVGVQTSPVQSLTVQSSPYPDATTSTIRNTPMVYAPSMSPTTPCTAVISGGMSVVGFGLSLGGSYEDKECTRREFARVLAQMGFPDAGVAVLCRNEEVAAAAPQLCKRTAYVSDKPEDYVGSEKPVMPPARIQAQKETVPIAAQPSIGTIGYGVNGAQFRYTGNSWVSEEAWQQQQRATATSVPKPETLQPKEFLK